MSRGNTCGYLDIQGVQRSLVPPGNTPEAYILIRVHLLGCSIVFKPLFNQSIYSLLPCDLFAEVEGTGEMNQTSSDDNTAVVTSKPRQTVNEIHIQQRVTTVRER